MLSEPMEQRKGKVVVDNIVKRSQWREWLSSEDTASKHRSLMASKETWSHYGGSQFCYSRPRGSSSGVPAGVARSHKLSLSFCWRSRLLVLPECAALWKPSFEIASKAIRTMKTRNLCNIAWYIGDRTIKLLVI